MLTALLDDVEKPRDIGSEVNVRIHKRVADSRLGRKMYNPLWTMFFKQPAQPSFISDVQLMKTEGGGS